MQRTLQYLPSSRNCNVITISIVSVCHPSILGGVKNVQLHAPHEEPTPPPFLRACTPGFRPACDVDIAEVPHSTCRIRPALLAHAGLAPFIRAWGFGLSKGAASCQVGAPGDIRIPVLPGFGLYGRYAPLLILRALKRASCDWRGAVWRCTQGT